MNVRDISTIGGKNPGENPLPLKIVKTKKVYESEFFWPSKFRVQSYTNFIMRLPGVQPPSRAKASILKISYSTVTTIRRKTDISKAGKSGRYAFYTGNLTA